MQDNDLNEIIEDEEQLQKHMDKSLIDQIKIKAKINNLDRFIVDKNDSESLPCPSTFSPRHNDTIKLPKMKIKQFSGDPSEWVSFFDSFEAAVDSNENLAKVDKMNYNRLPLSRTLGISNISLSRTKCSVPCYESTLN